MLYGVVSPLAAGTTTFLVYGGECSARKMRPNPGLCGAVTLTIHVLTWIVPLFAIVLVFSIGFFLVFVAEVRGGHIGASVLQVFCKHRLS